MRSGLTVQWCNGSRVNQNSKSNKGLGSQWGERHIPPGQVFEYSGEIVERELHIIAI
jgi:hypothetical protein